MNGRPVESEKETKLNLLPSKGLSSDFLSSMIFQTNPWFDNERTLYTNNNNKQPTPITNSMTETGRIKEDVDTPPYEFPEDASISLEQVLVGPIFCFVDLSSFAYLTFYNFRFEEKETSSEP